MHPISSQTFRPTERIILPELDREIREVDTALEEEERDGAARRRRLPRLRAGGTPWGQTGTAPD